MNALSVNSISNKYVQVAVAQQRVSSDRAEVINSEKQLIEIKAKLDEDLTYLTSLQRKTFSIQQLEGSQAQTNALDRIDKNSQATQQALDALSSANTTNQTIGVNIDITA